MTTQNPRVAGYIPQNIHDRFKSFKEERGINGDSQALAVLMAEFFKLPHHATQLVDYSGFATQEQIGELSSRLSELAVIVEKNKSLSDLMSKLPNRMIKLEERVFLLENVVTQPELSSFPEEGSEILPSVVPGQMDLLSIKTADNTASKSESLVDLSSSPVTYPNSVSVSGLGPMKEAGLAERLNVGPRYPSNRKNHWKDEPEKFAEWTKKLDPDGIPWRYDSNDKFYHPILNDSLVDLSESPI